MHQAQLVSLDLQEELDHQAQLVQWESPDLLVLQEKKVLMDFVEITEHLEDKENEDHLDHLVALETKETLEKMVPRVLMDLQGQLELQDKEALWVFLVREESVECPVFLDQRVHQGNKEGLDQLGIKVPQVQLVFQGLTDLVVILVLMVLLDLTAHQERMVFLDKEEPEEILVQRV